MLQLSSQKIMEICQCSKSTAIEIRYSNLLESKKLYLNKKNNSTATLNWLKKNFGAIVSKIQNDAPRGGKTGDFVTFKTNQKFDELCQLVLAENEKHIKTEKDKKESQQASINAMVISEAEKKNFLEKTKNLSNKKSRVIAHNFAGRKLGFYSSDGRDKFMNLKQ